MTLKCLVRQGYNTVVVPDPPPGGDPTPPQTTYVVPSSIDHVNSSNTTAAQQAFIDSCPDGTATNQTVIQWQPNGSYGTADPGLSLINRKYITLDFNGSTLKSTTPGNDAQILISTSDGLHSSPGMIVENFTIWGSNPATAPYPVNKYVAANEHQYGIGVSGNVQYVVKNGAIRNVYGDCVWQGAGPNAGAGPFPSGEITVVACNLAARQLISVVAGACRIHHCPDLGLTIGGAARHCFDFEPDGVTWVVDGVTVDHNEYGESHLGYVAGGGAGTVNNVHIGPGEILHGTPATITVPSGHAPGTRENWTVDGVTATGSGSSWQSTVVLAPLTFNGVDNLTVRNVVQPITPGDNNYGIMTVGCTNVAEDSNTFTGAIGDLVTRASIASISPTQGTHAGGTTVTLFGTGLNTVTAITFAANPGTSYTSALNGLSATVVTPPLSPFTQSPPQPVLIPQDGATSHQPVDSAPLSKNQVLPETIVIKDASDTTTYVLGTDYTLDLITGNYRIKRIAGGAITAGSTVTAHYQYMGAQSDIVYTDPYGTVTASKIYQYLAT